MIATISMQSQCTATQTHSHHMLSLTANAAGDPLPLIPRRSQSSPSWPLPLSSSPSLSAPSSLSPSGRNEPTIPASASIVTITPATPPKTESDSDSSPLRRRKRRKRDARVPNPAALYPPELTTPMPTRRTTSSPTLNSTWSPNSKFSASFYQNAPGTPTGGTRAPLVYTPSMPFRFSTQSLGKSSAPPGLSLHNVHSLRPSSSVSESLSSSSSLSSVSNASTASPTSTPLIRKKCGQVVRPSLKSSSSYSTSRSASNLCIMSPDLSFPSSKSEPVTPFTVTTPNSSKAVHFDKNLERVKLFLTEQKPLAVSRDGSPVDTDEGETSASGAESNEITRFFGSISLLGDPNKKPTTTKLLMHTNVPLRSLSLLSPSADVTLEGLLLAKGEKSIQGSVLVRNIAYDKSVAARFSFDGWCTRSEVNAKWKEGVGATREGRNDWDRFEFVIWLGDLKLGEEKGNSRKLELAVRYRVASMGYEQWDNHGGRNYVATFERPGLLLEEKERPPLKKQVPPVPFSDDELSGLLDKAATSKTNRKSPTSMSLDFSASCKPVVHTRTRSFPFSGSSPSESMQSAFGWIEKSPPLSSSPVVTAWSTKMGTFKNQGGMASATISPNKTVPPASPTTLGSPRDLGDDTFHPQFKFPTILGNDPEEGVDDSRPEGRKLGRHQRGGYSYFDFSPERVNPQGSTDVRGTAEPTPPPSSRYHSFPPLGLGFRDSTSPREDRQTLGEYRVKDSPMDSSQGSFVSQGKIETPAAEVNLGQSADDTSDSSSTSTLLENESPRSSRSSTPTLEDEPDMGQTNDDDRELYTDFLNRFCFFTGPGSPPSLSNTRLDKVMNKMMMMNESSSESTTPTITPSGSI